jgi:ParB-like chromosome segregation protein Spo0J
LIFGYINNDYDHHVRSSRTARIDSLGDGVEERRFNETESSGVTEHGPGSPRSKWVPRGKAEIGSAALVPIDSLLPADSPRLSGENAEHVNLLAAADQPLPPILVHRRTMRVIDGMHRLRAARRNGRKKVEVRFVDGAEEDIFVLAVQMNIAHGLPLSTADRSAAAERVVRTHAHWSDRAIATATGISATTVAVIRRRVSGGSPRSQARTGQDGRVRPLSAAQGRTKASEIIASRPNASLREIATASGISISTARDVRRRMRNGEAPVPPPREPALTPRRGPNRTEPGAEPAPGDPSSILAVLQRDPALKYNDQGRAFLQWLTTRLVHMDEWPAYVDAIPAHCKPAVVTLANQCTRAWKSFADEFSDHIGS